MKATTRPILEALAAAADGAIILPLSEEIYPVRSLAAATAAFAEYCQLESRTSPMGSLLSIEVRYEHRANSRQVIGECLNFLLVHAAQKRMVSGQGPLASEPE